MPDEVTAYGSLWLNAPCLHAGDFLVFLFYGSLYGSSIAHFSTSDPYDDPAGAVWRTRRQTNVPSDVCP